MSSLHRVLVPLWGTVAALALWGCGGGGGTTANTPPVPSNPAPAPTPIASPPSPAPVAAAPLVQGRYDIGNPVLTTLFVSTTDNDANDGLSSVAPLRTLTAAWQKVPRGTLAGTGYRILLAPGTYPEASLPNYMDGRHGSRDFPILITAETAGTVTLAGDLNVYDVRHLYLVNLNITPQPAGDALHCELCQHLLLRDSVLSGGNRVAQETIKINQSQHVYLEGNNISGAWDNAIDYVGVQYGHVVGNTIHNAGDWCQYAKGGSAYLRVEGNTYTNCGTGGFTAGQGTGFQFMTSPWLHYEAYDIRFINNVVHNVEGAAIGAQGAFNVLFAHNTFYRIGSRSHVFEAVAGLRSCDGQPGDAGRERCQQYLNAGGWGTTVVDNGSNAVRIPNRNVQVVNNIFYNPTGSGSRWQHFQIFGALANPAGSNVPLDARSDAGLVLRGNVIWNGPSNHPLGIEDGSACPATHATCAPNLLTAQNSINALEPQLANPAAGDFQPAGNGNVASFPVAAITNFVWTDLPTTPAVPHGGTDNTVSHNMLGQARSAINRVGAY
ncbi:MAG: right-handed parallel beta-helix repeat-containing protein [Burkholderiales bacterium]